MVYYRYPVLRISYSLFTRDGNIAFDLGQSAAPTHLVYTGISLRDYKESLFERFFVVLPVQDRLWRNSYSIISRNSEMSGGKDAGRLRAIRLHAYIC